MWSEILANTGIIAGLTFTGLGYWRDARVRRAQTLLDLAKSHREIWLHLRTIPEAAALKDSKRDLRSRPRTQEETRIVNLLLIHLQSVFQAKRSGIFVLPERLRDDVRAFFSFPVPRDAWNELKAFHDRAFVLFVDEALSD
jgi:hypothetical protein